MTPVAALRPDHQCCEAGRQALHGLAAGCGHRVHNLTRVCPAWRSYLGVKVLYTPDRGKC